MVHLIVHLFFFLEVNLEILRIWPIPYLLDIKHKKRALQSKTLFLAENEGFEPPVPCGTPVFKTGPFDHSGNSPRQKYWYFNYWQELFSIFFDENLFNPIFRTVRFQFTLFNRLKTTYQSTKYLLYHNKGAVFVSLSDQTVKNEKPRNSTRIHSNLIHII